MKEIRIADHSIHFQMYPFPASTIYPNGRIDAECISEILIDRFPPEVRTNKHEILFVTATLKDELVQFAQSHDIPIVLRIDSWSWIGEEFLDTEQTAEDKEQVYQILEKEGLDRTFVKETRDFIHVPMMLYNSFFWEWAHLGLYDVLLAVSGQFPNGDKVKFSDEAFERFYWHAMEIAMRESKR